MGKNRPIVAPKPAVSRAPRTGESLEHTCHECGEFVTGDELSIWRESDAEVWFVHNRHNPEATSDLYG